MPMCIQLPESAPNRLETPVSVSLAHAAFDAIATPLAILTLSGMITTVNAAWRAVATNNRHPLCTVSEGSNYLTLWDAYSEGGDVVATTHTAAIRAVAAGTQPMGTCDYHCNALAESFWLALRVSAFTVEGETFLLVSQEDITKSKRIEIEHQAYRHQQTIVAQLERSALAGTDLAVLIDMAVDHVAQTLDLGYPPALRNTLHAETSEKNARSAHDQPAPVVAAKSLNAVQYSAPLSDQATATTFYCEQCSNPDPVAPLENGTQERTLFLQSVTNVLAAAVERRWYECAIESIVMVTSTLRTAPNRTAMLPVILDQLLDLLNAQAAALAIHDLVSGETVIELGRGIWAHQSDTHLPRNEGVTAQVIATGRSYLNNNVTPDTWTHDHNLPGEFRAVICIPLVAREQIIGALWIGSQTRISDHEIQLLTVIGDIAANAIHRVSLHERLAELYSHLNSRERFISRILESIPSSLVVIDRGLRVVSANHNYLEKARREPQNTLGRKLELVFPAALLEYTRLDQKVRDVFRLGHSIEGGKLAYRAPGLPTRIYYYRLIPLRFDEVIENVILFMDDITEREQLEENVRRAEQHLASVVTCASDLVISMDSYGSIVSWNAAAERTSGLPAERVRGKTLLSLCAVQHRPVMAEMLHELTDGESVRNREVHLLTANEKEIPIAWSCAPLRNHAGEVVGTVVVGRDLTEQRQLEAQLVQSAKMASLGVMAGGIAHELRNPLGIILASAHLLLEYPNDANLRSTCVQKIHTATRRASLIIENLLKFAHPNSERMRNVDVHTILAETLTLLADQLVVQQLVIQQELAVCRPIIYGNPELIQQVFTNLILNACNILPQGGSLTISTALIEDNHQVEIQFRDGGPGIIPENLPRIFDPFFTTMPVGKGTGLGLSISYSIIRQHQGTITVLSEPHKGATFTIRLPTSGALPDKRRKPCIKTAHLRIR